MQALCRLILLSMHYVAQPSVAIWARGDTTSVSAALTIHSLTPALHAVSTSLSFHLLGLQAT